MFFETIAKFDTFQFFVGYLILRYVSIWLCVTDNSLNTCNMPTTLGCEIVEPGHLFYCSARYLALIWQTF